MKVNNTKHIPSKTEDILDTEYWDRLQVNEYRFEDGEEGKRVIVDEEPVYARLSRTEGYGRTKRSSTLKKWIKPEGEIETSSSGARGTHQAGSTGGPTVEIEPDIDDLWEGEFEPSREYTIKLESDAVYHVDDRDNRIEITRYERKDDDYLHEWCEGVPKEDRELTIGEDTIELAQNSDLNSLRQEVRGLIPEESDIGRVTQDLLNRLQEEDRVKQVGRESLDGDVVRPDKTWIKNEEGLFELDHDGPLKELEGFPAYQAALSYIANDDEDIENRIKTAVPTELGLSKTLSDWVEALQKDNINHDLRNHVLDTVRENRDDRIESHVYGDISDFDYWDPVETEDAIYEVEGVEATRVNGKPRIESVQGTEAPAIELRDIDEDYRFVKRYIAEK